MNIILLIVIIGIVIFIKIEFNKALREKKKNFRQKNKKRYHQSKYNNSYENKNQEETMNTTKIAEHFNLSARELNKIFEELQWIYKKDKWWLATELGKKQGAKEFYDVKRKTKYIKWNINIINNDKLKEKINFKESPITEKKTRFSNKEKKQKGDRYEEYIANFFKEQGYTVWEHGKEKGVHDSSIDLIIKKEKYIYFVQCKNWNNWKINHKEVKATRTDVREYLKKNQTLWSLIKNYKSKILYITPKECLTKSAYTYIKENSEIVEYQTIPMK